MQLGLPMMVAMASMMTIMVWREIGSKGISEVILTHAELEQLEREAWLIARRIHRMVNGDGGDGETWDGQCKTKGKMSLHLFGTSP